MPCTAVPHIPLYHTRPFDSLVPADETLRDTAHGSPLRVVPNPRKGRQRMARQGLCRGTSRQARPRHCGSTHGTSFPARWHERRVPVLFRAARGAETIVYLYDVARVKDKFDMSGSQLGPGVERSFDETWRALWQDGNRLGQ